MFCREKQGCWSINTIARWQVVKGNGSIETGENTPRHTYKPPVCVGWCYRSKDGPIVASFQAKGLRWWLKGCGSSLDMHSWAWMSGSEELGAYQLTRGASETPVMLSLSDFVGGRHCFWIHAGYHGCFLSMCHSLLTAAANLHFTLWPGVTTNKGCWADGVARWWNSCLAHVRMHCILSPGGVVLGGERTADV